MNSWRLGFADAWPTWNKMICMICYMLHCKHLHDRYGKSDFFFFFWFYISLLSCFHGISAKSSKQYYFKFPEKYFSVNHIQDGSFWAAHGSGCKNAHLHKICHTYPKMMKRGTVIPYLTKIQNIYKYSFDDVIKIGYSKAFLK